jgi:hypothetical protein
VSDRFRRGGDRYLYRLRIRCEQADFALTASTDSIVVTADKPAELPLDVHRYTGRNGSVGPVRIEAVDLPPGITASPAVSEPDGPTADKVTLSFSTSGAAFSGPIRIRGSAETPCEIERFARTPAKFAAGFEAVWLTSVAEP